MGCANSQSVKVAKPKASLKKVLVVSEGDIPALTTEFEAPQHENTGDGYDVPKSTFTYLVNPVDENIADGCYDLPTSTFTFFVNPGADDVPLSGVYHMSAEAGVDAHADESASKYTVGRYAAPLRTTSKWRKENLPNQTEGNYACPGDSPNDGRIGGCALPVCADAKRRKDELPKGTAGEYALPKGIFVDASADKASNPLAPRGALPSLYLSARAASAYATPANAYAGYALQASQANSHREQQAGHTSYQITSGDDEGGYALRTDPSGAYVVKRAVASAHGANSKSYPSKSIVSDGYSTEATGILLSSEQKGRVNSGAYLLRQGSLAYTIAPASGDGVPLFSCDLE